LAGLIDRLLYLKLCWNRANSHLALPLGIIDKMAIVTLLFKAFNINYWWILGVFFAVLILVFFILGHYDVKFNILARENSLGNKYNPEIQRLLNK